MAAILVVDDSSYARRVLRQTLERAGHTVTEANSGLTALESYALRPADLVLLDLTMEDMTGLDVLGKLHELDQKVRVIVISADVQQTTERLVQQAGARRFLGKPASKDDLLSAVDDVLGVRRQ
jgi:two-component system, chemotaxis family, chemotaxis protein CheY